MDVKKIMSFLNTAFYYSSFISLVISIVYSLGVWIPEMDFNLCFERYSSADGQGDNPPEESSEDKLLVNDYESFKINANGAYDRRKVAVHEADPEDGSTVQEVVFKPDLDKAGYWKKTVSIREGEKHDLTVEGEIDLGHNRIPASYGDYKVTRYTNVDRHSWSGHRYYQHFDGHHNVYLNWYKDTRIPRMDEDPAIIFLEQITFPTKTHPSNSNIYPVLNVNGREQFEITVGGSDTSNHSKTIQDIFGNTVTSETCDEHSLGGKTIIPSVCSTHYMKVRRDKYFYHGKNGHLLFFKGETNGNTTTSGMLVNHGVHKSRGIDTNWSKSELKSRVSSNGLTPVDGSTITQDNFSLDKNNNTLVKLSVTILEPAVRPHGNKGDIREYGYTSDISHFESSFGGYYVKLRQSGMLTENNETIDKYGFKRGHLEAIVMPNGFNPNEGNNLEEKKLEDLEITKGDKVKNKQLWKTNKASNDGVVWVRIRNESLQDYKDSKGSYNVKFLGMTRKISARFAAKNDFNEKIASPVLSYTQEKFNSIYKDNFKRLICYDTDKSKCSSFLTYVKLLLTLYVMTFGLQYLLGSISISQTELITRVVKIGLVASLISGRAFEFFDNYVFDLIVNGSTRLLLAFTGADPDAPDSHPFNFASDFLNEMFMSPRGYFKVMALLAVFPFGPMIFVIVLVATMLALIAILRVMMIYIMALIAMSLLLSLTPIFLTFLLFDTTKTLFDNWVSTLFRYMLEPIIAFIGVPVLVKFVTVYYDKVTAFSVCFKCVAPFSIPLSWIFGEMGAQLGELTVGCITWFSPWGYDPVYNSEGFGINFANFIVLFMASMILYNYVNITSTVVNSITPGLGSGTAAPPVSGTAQGTISSAVSDIKNTASSAKGMKRDAFGDGGDEKEGANR